jgi:hypothetical protein
MIRNHFKVIAIITWLLSSHANAQDSDSGPDTQFYTYTNFSVVSSESMSAEGIQAAIDLVAAEAGGSVYAIWNSVVLADDAPFNGLVENDVIAMLSFDSGSTSVVDRLDSLFKENTRIVGPVTKLYYSVDLRVSGTVSTPKGFYVHRDEHYPIDAMNTAVSLSQRAWMTWEDYWQVKVVGLFRQVDDEQGVAKLNRIVWYPSYEVWQSTRNNTDAQSRERFRERRQLLIEGSGVAVATNRL